MSAVDWSRWQFLMGEWVGEGTGEPGEGTGGFTFALDLQEQILVRKNMALYPATTDRPAFRHDDLLIIYQQGDATRATYFDNEGHVISYHVAFSENERGVIFVSESVPSEPRFRLTYEKEGEAKVSIRFEIAPPGKLDEFAIYLNAQAHRK